MASTSSQSEGHAPKTDAPRGHVAREHLPIPDPKHVGLTTYDAKDPEHELPADHARCGRPKGAPNVLIVLLDDVGFGASSRVRRTVQHARSPNGWPPMG